MTWIFSDVLKACCRTLVAFEVVDEGTGTAKLYVHISWYSLMTDNCAWPEATVR